jgi:hypothetical protein
MQRGLSKQHFNKRVTRIDLTESENEAENAKIYGEISCITLYEYSEIAIDIATSYSYNTSILSQSDYENSFYSLKMGRTENKFDCENLVIFLDQEYKDKEYHLFYDYKILLNYLKNKNEKYHQLKIKEFNKFHKYIDYSSTFTPDQSILNFPKFLNISTSSFQKMNLNEWLNDEVILFNLYFLLIFR